MWVGSAVSCLLGLPARALGQAAHARKRLHVQDKGRLVAYSGFDHAVDHGAWHLELVKPEVLVVVVVVRACFACPRHLVCCVTLRALRWVYARCVQASLH